MSSLTPQEIAKRIDKGIHQGVANALAKHKAAGQSISVWQDGKVVRIPASKIKIDAKKS